MNSVGVILGSLLAVFFNSAFAAETVNINRANAAKLDRELVGVGPVKAKAIVVERRRHGPFKSADDLSRVKGIGPKLIEMNRTKIVVADSDDAMANKRSE